ncbi:MAG: response regulator transcription factor [Gammaproteobacteria bacterium]|nr:response regulator transcription factor [Gammaproteobacteria bacterium]
MRVLLAEDDKSLGQGISDGLQKLGFCVDWLQDGLSIEHAIMNDDGIDILILDLGLPRKDGLDVLKTIRAADKSVSVLILTARDAVEQRIAGLDLGADDYMLKPFDLHELAARLRAIVRRKSGFTQALLSYGDLQVNLSEHSVKVQGQQVNLSHIEFAILEHLLTHIGQVVSKQRIESLLYGWSEGVESNAIEVHIHHLRKKLGKELIKTLRGLGYMVPKINTDA